MRQPAVHSRPFMYAIWAILLLLTISVSMQSASAQQLESLRSHVAAPSNSQLLGRLPAAQQMRLSLSLPLRNQAQLESFLQQVYNPSSPNYHHFLTVQQFIDQYGPTAQDYEKVTTFAAAHGFTVTRTFSNRLLVNVSGSSSSVEQAFHVKMQSYQHPTENRKFYAPNTEPSVESGVPILSVDGISTLNLPHSMLQHAAKDAVHSDTTGSGQGGQFLGSDIRAAYAPGVTLNGSGQSVGLIELGPYNLSDVQAYFSTIGQSLNVPIYNVLLDVDGVCLGTPASNGCDDGEEVADMEQAISMAPGLSGLVIYEAYGSGSDALTAFTQAANDNIAKQLSLSFGWGGTPSTEPGYEQIFMELAAQGQNVFVASGDSGANVGGVGYPGNSTYITAVGGTDLTTSGAGGPWLSETGWIGSTGGWNTQAPIASYQVPVINAANQGSTTFRNIPDVSAEANTDNYNCLNAQCGGGLGGTSLAAPRWAGFLALINEQANGSPVGALNPTIYAIGQGSNYTNVFHDITTGNDFNSSSPNMFSAVTGYDLVTGWGTPNGQGLIDTLAPSNAGNPNFSVTASPTSIPLAPGGNSSGTVTVSASNGFSGAVALSAAAIGAPAGVTVTLNPTTITGSGSSTLSVSTTAATPGGTFLLAINAIGNGLQKTAYVQLALPSFTVSASPATIYLNQGSVATGAIAVTPQNGFDGTVAFTAPSGLPDGVTAKVLPGGTAGTSKLFLKASSTAATLPIRELAVTGTSGATTEVVPELAVAVSAALGDCGTGVPVNLASAYNLTGVYTDGTTFTTNGLDGDGYAFSSNILTSARTLNGVRFLFGKPNVPNAVYGTGQTIDLPAGRFASLQMLATGINGNQTAQVITVTYTDGTTSQFTQSYSDWFSPSTNVNEAEAVAMPYRDTATGTKDARQFNLYGYTLVLDSHKIVKSLTLPSNRNVVILAVTLSPEDLGTEVNLSSAFNATGIYTDGTSFSADGGLDGGGAAYSAQLLGDQSGAITVVANGVQFTVDPANQPNAVYGAGANINLPPGRFSTLNLLGTGVQGGQTAQTITVTYLDGKVSHLTQSFSDWFSPQNFANESIATTMAYRDLNDGSQDTQKFNLYEYTLHLDSNRIVKSIQLPNNRDVVVLGITLGRAEGWWPSDYPEAFHCNPWIGTAFGK
jgi:hypothetical protein